MHTDALPMNTPAPRQGRARIEVRYSDGARRDLGRLPTPDQALIRGRLRALADLAGTWGLNADATTCVIPLDRWSVLIELDTMLGWLAIQRIAARA